MPDISSAMVRYRGDKLGKDVYEQQPQVCDSAAGGVGWLGLRLPGNAESVAGD